MSETLTAAVDADLHAVRRVARTLEPVPPHERRWVQRDEAALLLDGLLVRVARGRGPLDLALGDGLASLTVGDRLLRLGFSGLGDYARERIGLSVRPEARAKLDQALALAGKALGAATPKWRRVEALCEEYLGSHSPPVEADDAAGWMLDHAPSGQSLEELKAWLEEETQGWDFIRSFDPAPRPAPDREAAGDQLAVEPVAIEPVLDLARLDADLRRLHELPALRSALRDGRVTYEKARIVAAHADEQSLDAWIGRASRLTCIALAREAEADEEAQTCARCELSWRLPARVLSLLEAALRAAQMGAGRFITAGEALELIAEHFIATWEPLLAERNTIQKRVLARDRGWCQVPGCSRAALHVHHVRFRSHLGPTVGQNLASLCPAHHLHGVHAGYLRVVGVAPDRLRWSFRPGGGPLLGPVIEPAARGTLEPAIGAAA
jgi:hypothetical protein